MIPSDVPHEAKSAVQRRALRSTPTVAPAAAGSATSRGRGHDADKATQAPLSFDRLPYLKRNPSGQPVKGLAIDYWAYAGQALLISGWVTGAEYERLGIGRAESSAGVVVSTFRRPDVENAFSSFVTGILAVITLTEAETFDLLGFQLAFPARRENDHDCATFLTEHSQRFGFLLEHIPDTSPERQLVANKLSPAPESYKSARAFLEQARGVPGLGGLAVGWAVTLPNVRLGLLDQAGNLTVLKRAIRWHRPDIVEALNQDFGNYTFNAGMLQSWHLPFRLGDEIRLIAFDGDAAYVLSTRQWEAAPIEPASFARWAFQLPTPVERFAERMEHHDGPIIKALVAQDRLSWRKTRPDIYSYGPDVEAPECSIIVPLYKRFDFMWNQLLEFSEDPLIKRRCELIYVVDDPRIASDVIQQAPLLYDSYGVPFRLVISPENRGFAGANNLGVSLSRSPVLLLLNSDVIPVEPGWLTRMLEMLNDRKIGIVGARLFFPNGSIQHDGLTFQWDATWQAFLNRHPRSGMEASEMPGTTSEDPAVTGACMLIRKSVYEKVGGLDEGFLIGDFEDSDLCLKVRKAGLQITCCRDINLTHLERQSFAHIGSDFFRRCIAHYNAWRHHRQWSGYIKSLLNNSKPGSSR